MLIYTYTYICWIHTDAMNNRRAKTSLKKYTSHFIVRLRVWEGVGDWTKTATYWPPLLWASALCLSRSPGQLSRRPRGPLCWLRAFSTASCHQRISKHHRGSRGPLLLCGGFPYHILSPTRLISNSLTSCFIELYDSSIAHSITHSIFGMACLIVIKRKYLSCSSEVTLFWGISLWVYHGLLPCPISPAKSAYAISFDYWPLECVTSFRCIILEWHVWPGRRSIYNIN